MFNVEVTAQASDEAEEAYLWMKENSPEAAADWFDGLVEKANSLANFPKRWAALAVAAVPGCGLYRCPAPIQSLLR